MEPAQDNKPLFAGGCLILVGFLGGSVLGIGRGEPSLGALTGVGIAVVLALAIYFLSRRRGS